MDMESANYQKRIISENQDRLSNLPEVILINILSKLEDKEVVQTCILSKRWCNLWAFVPSLHFDFHSFKGDAEQFNNFVSSFLHLRDAYGATATDVDTFTLNYAAESTLEMYRLFARWTLYAIKHGVKNLVLDIWDNYFHLAPDWLFTNCNTLEYLHFNCVAMMQKLDHVMCLPRLRNLSLHRVDINTTSIQKLLSGCPLLETLTICHASLRTDNIVLSTVKRLTMENCFFYSLTEPIFSISAPRLNYLKFVKCSGNRITFKDMPRVTEAIIAKPNHPKRTYNFHLLNGISGVECLNLSIIYLQDFMNQELKNGATFNSLRHLIVESCWKNCGLDLNVVSVFLNRCPYLKNLRLSHVMQYSEECFGEENLEISTTKEIKAFSCQSLELIEIVHGEHIKHHCIRQLEKLIVQWTKEMNRIRIEVLSA